MRMLISLIISFVIMVILLHFYSTNVQPYIEKASKVYAEQIIKHLESVK